MKLQVSLTAILLLSGCAATAGRTHLPPEVQWYRNSAESRAVYEEVYAQALAVVRERTSSLAPGSWAVILDVDETVLDNSGYEVRLAISGQDYGDKSWAAWVHDQQAEALPGAAAFLHAVRSELHGHVALVTNRYEEQCRDTEANLRKQSLEYDEIHCAGLENGQHVGDKNPRFQLVKARFDVIAYVGDNIQDFPGLTQAAPGDASHFGKDYFVLPNPMYGSWVENASR